MGRRPVRLLVEKPGYYEALKRFIFDEMSHEEIAQAMGKTKDSLRNFIHRGKLKLGDYMKEEIRYYTANSDEYEEELRHFASNFDIEE